MSDVTFFHQIVSSFHVLAAVNKALVSRDHNQMKTKSIYSEIIFDLSPSTNVSFAVASLSPHDHRNYLIVQMRSAFKTFGIKDDLRSVLCVVVHQREDDNMVCVGEY